WHTRGPEEPVPVAVRFRDDGPPPDGAVKVTIDRTLPKQPGGPPAEADSQTIQLAPKEGTRATFETPGTRAPEGESAFPLARPPTTGTRPKAEGRVLPPPGEMDRIQLNESDLQ